MVRGCSSNTWIPQVTLAFRPFLPFSLCLSPQWPSGIKAPDSYDIALTLFKTIGRSRVRSPPGVAEHEQLFIKRRCTRGRSAVQRFFFSSTPPICYAPPLASPTTEALVVAKGEEASSGMRLGRGQLDGGCGKRGCFFYATRASAAMDTVAAVGCTTRASTNA